MYMKFNKYLSFKAKLLKNYNKGILICNKIEQSCQFGSDLFNIRDTNQKLKCLNEQTGIYFYYHKK